ncbi:MAG TPA: hypothetical protein VFF65_05320 [Phycisphaerales bacterium]|nr:hypothetical protein [Phycisphaerales bacterium]
MQWIASGTVLLLFSGCAAAHACGWAAVAVLLGCLTAVTTVMLVVLLIFWPLAQAELLTERHQPRRSRHGPYVGLLLLGWIVSAFVGAVFLALVAVSALLIGLMS